MAKWKTELDLSDFWNDESLEPCEIADKIVKQMRNILNQDEKYYLIAREFERLANDKDTELDDIDSVLENLYDWADYHRMWVKTF